MLHDHVSNTVTRVLGQARTRKSITASVVAAIALLGAGSTNAAPMRSRLPGALTKVSLFAKAGVVTVSIVAAGSFILGRGASPEVEAARPIPPLPERSGPSASPWPAAIAPTSVGDQFSPRSTITKKSLLAFDFEDGLFPAIFREGHLVPCPDLPDSRFCVLATPVWEATNQMIAFGSRDRRSTLYDAEIDTDSTLFRYSPTAVLSFDYRIETAESTGLGIAFWNNDKDAKYTFYVSVKSKTLVYGAWSHAELRLANFRPVAKGVRPLEPGDGIRNISIVAGRIGDGPFYVDNVQVTDSEVTTTTTLP
jgi:hypothetical protein